MEVLYNVPLSVPKKPSSRVISVTCMSWSVDNKLACGFVTSNKDLAYFNETCVCVCVYIRTYVHACAFTCIYVCVSMSTCLSVVRLDVVLGCVWRDMIVLSV
jgi:hypothetical protein